MIKMRALIAFIIFLFLSMQAYSQIIVSGSDSRQIALTFDDGPSFKWTPKVLDILKKEKIKATFFVVGQRIEQNPEILKAIADAGHEIENHTYYHSRISGMNDKELLDELKMTDALINKVTGKKVSYFRPPHGDFKKTERDLVEKAGYKFVLWSVHADDFYLQERGMRTSRSITKRVLALVKGGDVVLAHDDSAQLVEALPNIIKGLKNRDFRFVKLSDLKIQHKLVNKPKIPY